MFKRQQEAIKQMNDQQLLVNLLLTQAVLFFISVVLYFFLFKDIHHLFHFVQLDFAEIIIYGGGLALLVIIVDFLFMKILPADMLDDGGVNERLFQKRSILEILFLTTIIAFTEEILFRGVLQTKFGIMIASVIFAILHIRYLSKWFLFILVTAISFLLGLVFELTNNLLTTMFSHFLIDFLFALHIRFQYLKSIKIQRGETFNDDEESRK
ncbi:CPBP family intramembrane glutamic endopeptidase [Bacillus sp. FJAT-47783]|uniref:CPBP family intramembrane glutamic endopeptidase n=1 Tax=Bacillus sp. FJAT-47783 TaxID=2922712 RepID=UPI001FAD4AD6